MAIELQRWSTELLSRVPPEILDVLVPWVFALLINSVLLLLAWLAPKKLLTPAGLAHAWILGIIIWGTLGWRGYAIMMFYFLAGSAVTRIGMAQKEALGIAEKRSGARGPENVWGSALTATICALGSYVVESTYFSWANQLVFLLILGYVASMSTKLSDTFASEIGKAYGKRTFLITTLKPVERGTEGAISLEGTVAGVVGSLLLASVAWGVGFVSIVGIVICAIAALIATSIESLIGATLQAKAQWLTNEMVNVINTAIGASVAILLGILLIQYYQNF